MADVATLVFDIDSSGAVGAAKALANLDRAAASTATMAAKLEKIQVKGAVTAASFADAVNKDRAEIERLAAAYNPALSAQLRFSAAQKDVALSVQKGVITSDQQAVILRRLEAQYTSSATAANGFGAAQNTAAMQTSNVFSQLNDIGVMLAAGQNPIQLALQQGTQLNQVWASMGESGKSVKGVAGMLTSAFASMVSPMSLLTIGVIAGGAALTQWAMSALFAEEETRKFEDIVSSANSAISDFRDANSALGEGLGQTELAYGRVTDEVRNLIEAQRMLAMDNAAAEITAMADSMASAFQRSGLGWVSFATDAQIRFAEVERQLSMTRGEATTFLAAWDAIGRANPGEEMADAIAMVRMEIELAASAQSGLTDEQKEAVKKLVEMEASARKFANVDMAAGVLAAGSAARVLADNLNISLANAQALAALGQQGTPGAGGGRGDPRTMGGSFIDWNTRDVDAFNKAWEEAEKKRQEAARKGGGGAGARELKAAQKNFQSIRELLEEGSLFQVAEWEKNQAQLDNALAKKLLSEQQFAEMKKQLQVNYFGTEYQQNQLQYDMDLQQLEAARARELLTEEQYLMKKRAMQDAYYSGAITTDQNATSQQLSQMAGAFSQMSQLAGGGYDKLLKAQKVFASGSALINAYLAASQALADPTVPFWMKIAAYAKVLAAGMGAVNAIKGGGSGGGASSATSAAAGKQEPTKNILVRLEGDSYLTGLAEDIMTQIYEQSKDGRVIITRDNS